MDDELNFVGTGAIETFLRMGRIQDLREMGFPYNNFGLMELQTAERFSSYLGDRDVMDLSLDECKYFLMEFNC